MKKTAAILLCFAALLFAEANQYKTLKKATVESAKYFDINRICTPIQNNGVFAQNPETKQSGLYYDNMPIIFVSGLWMAAIVDSQVRASASDYLTDFIGSRINDAGNPVGANDSTFRVYKISTGDDASNSRDYSEWPINLGAPADKYGKPLLIGDQTLWCSFTDAYQTNREYNPCPPLNAEIHLTVWGLDSMPDVVFFRWKFLNKSLKEWRSAHVGLFIDPDIADASHNLVGSDSSLSMVYAFEPTRYQMADSTFAAGYMALELPTVTSPGDTAVTFYGPLPGFKNSEVIAPLVYKHYPLEWAVPQHGKNYAKSWIYRRLAGQDTAGHAMINPITGKPTKWGISGDPISKTGWIDESPQDRFMMISTGPFDLAPGASNAMTIAIITVPDSNYFGIVPRLKQRATEVKAFFKESMRELTNVNFKPVGVKRSSDYQLFQNYPNPFNATTKISYVLAEPGLVKLSIFNLLGKEIAMLTNERQQAGSYEVLWIAESFPSGTYFCRLKTNEFQATQKLVLVK